MNFNNRPYHPMVSDSTLSVDSSKSGISERHGGPQNALVTGGGRRRSWVTWIDEYGSRICAAVFLAFFLIYFLLVYVSGQRSLTPLEQASMALIGLVVPSILGVVLAIPFAKRKVKIGSQLRRAYGISKTLRNVQRDIDDARARMRTRNYLTDAAVVSEFWEEIAGSARIGLREPILAAERMLADWGEMDPDEWSRIQAEEQQTNEQIQELTKEVESAKSLEKDLQSVGEGKTDAASAKLASTVAQLEQRIRELQEPRPIRGIFIPSGSAKNAFDLGHYREAVELYDDLIRRYPRVHTNYIGRAKARYLTGDKEGALSDLSLARSIFANDPVIDDLEDDIRSGRAVSAPVSSAARDEAFKGNDALANGDAETAAQHYKKAEELGWNSFFSTFNLAMVSCLQGDTIAARDLLVGLPTIEDSYMSINKRALEAIAAVSNDDLGENDLRDLRRHTADLFFDYTRSPLRFLESGLRATADERLESLESIFAILKHR